MNHSRRSSLVARLLSYALLMAPLSAQWLVTPHSPASQLFDGGWFVAHETPAGIEVCSAIAQTWNLLSPSGATIVHAGDSVLVTAEAGLVLRGWSAFSNSSATQTVSANYTSLVSTQYDTSYCIIKDNAPGTNGVLRAYSAYTNTWSSLSLPSVTNTGLTWGLNAAVQKEGLNYHAYSAYTGQWNTLTTTVAGSFPIAGIDFVATDLHLGSGSPFQYAAFSAPRGVWTLSPNYPSTGGSGVLSINNCSVFAIKVPDPAPNSFRYAAYSPYTAQWATSTMVHTTTAAPSAAVRTNLIRVLDNNVAARCEMFGAGNGIWQSLTGANFTEVLGNNDNALVMRSPTSSPTTVYFASAMVGGGFTSVDVPGALVNLTMSPHGGILYGGVSQATSQAWGYSAATNVISPPVALLSYSLGGFGCAFGVLSTNSTAKAYSTRWGTWVDGPTVTNSGWNVASGGTSLAIVGNGPVLATTLQAFDEHSNQWLPAVSDGPRVMGENGLVVLRPNGVWDGLSSQTAQWSTVTGVGNIVSNGGQPRARENLTWFYDAAHLYVFCTPTSTQTWAQYPASTRFTMSGTVGGAAPSLDVSLRGNPGIDFALLYASAGLSPTPLSIPGIGGALDLDVSAFQIAAALVGSSGIVPVRLTLPATLPPGLQIWLQGVLVDLTNGQIRFAGRATSTTIF